MRVGEVSTRDRFRGCLVGLAVGDALGTTLEFSPPGSLRRSNYSSSEVGERPPGVPTRLSSVSARATSCSGVDGLSAWSGA